ncbi:MULTISPECIES: hypothetical protein [unclassified Rhizobium]|uniref:hypothetical protein n=1 Tax=unclassified Rhizobium TaxID=2613769 RepID=UPI00138F33D8|nr:MULTISPECIES: hypothetical protein [unclassified Rhizobium]
MPLALHGMKVGRVDPERVEVAVQRTAVAFDCCGSGRGRAENGEGVTEKASGRFTGTHLFAHFPVLVASLFDDRNMSFTTPVYNAQEFIPAMQIEKARSAPTDRAFSKAFPVEETLY